MKERSQIDEKFKWDLSPLCESDEKYYAMLDKVQNEYLPKFKAFEGKLNNKETIYQYLMLDREFALKVHPIIRYAYLKSDEIMSDNARNEMMEKKSHIFSQFNVETSFISSELHDLSDEILDDIIADPKFADFNKDFIDIKKSKKHMLSKAEEKLIAGMDFLGGFSDNMDKLSDVDLDFGEIEDSKGEKYKLDGSNYGKYCRSKDRTLRKNALQRLNGEYGKHINLLANNYICDVKATCYFSKIRKYNSALENALENEEVDERVYTTLVEMVNKNLDILFDYYKLKQKEMGLEDFYIYDSLAEDIFSEGESKTYTYDEAIEIIKKAVAPLGEEYVNLIQKAKDERWIDVYPNKDKATGAYATHSYGVHPYVLTNFEGELDDVFTLAHELGHAMHSYFSCKNQPLEKSQYVIFLAEIASTTNEILLINYLLSQAKDKIEKKNLYNKLFDSVKATIYRQTMFAEFEQWAHNTYECGQALTKDKLCSYYYSLVQRYFQDVKLIDEIKYEWARIPHFFSSFYVYKYSTGMISAICFANRILEKEEGAVEDYLRFLCSGGSETPMEILRKSKCDIGDIRTFENSFSYLRQMLTDWKNLK